MGDHGGSFWGAIFQQNLAWGCKIVLDPYKMLRITFIAAIDPWRALAIATGSS